MNVYDYRTIPPEESAYHFRTSHTSGKEQDADSQKAEDVIPDEVPRRDGPGGN